MRVTRRIKGRKNARRRLKPMRYYRQKVKNKYRMYRKNNDFRRY